MRPFEDQTSLEFMSQKNDASLFAFGSHSKKRPHNLVFGKSPTCNLSKKRLLISLINPTNKIQEKTLQFVFDIPN